jgi:hypothetical protein
MVSLVVLVILGLIGFGLVAWLTPVPPMADIQRCQQALSEAKQKGAEEYATTLYWEAEYNYEKGMREWKYQNEKFCLSRNYDSLKNIINLAKEKADSASIKSLKLKSSLKDLIEFEVKSIQSYINDFTNVYANLPMSAALRKNFTQGQMLISESKESYERGDLQGAANMLKTGKNLIIKANKDVEKMLKGYLENLPKWQKWVDETIEWSKKNKESAIVVDKMSQLCIVYKNGKIKQQFRAEFGRNWLGDKRYKGDNATPEGRYQIIKKLGSRYTKYYKALLINYPNSEDKDEFTREIRNGSLPKWSKIGNLIEIHGNGGKGINWTNGCVALSDSDMDRLFEFANVGTPVTIVGSLKSFSELKEPFN